MLFSIKNLCDTVLCSFADNCTPVIQPPPKKASEVHPDIDQFFRIEEGEAYVKVNDEEFNLKDDDIIIIPAGSEHYVKNSSEDKVLKVYTIYTPAEHPEGTVHKTKEEADAAEHHD